VLFLMFQVYSGYRFVVRAHELGKFIAIVNIGPTRADGLAHVKVDGRCSDVLKKIEM
jgi:NAD+-dependent protein deacetylase sirtuin 4